MENKSTQLHKEIESLKEQVFSENEMTGEANFLGTIITIETETFDYEFTCCIECFVDREAEEIEYTFSILSGLKNSEETGISIITNSALSFLEKIINDNIN